MTKRKTPPTDGQTTSRAINGYLIQQRGTNGLTQRYWSVREGCWRREAYGTFFETIGAAEAYAAEFGLVIGHDAEVVTHGF